MISEERLRQAAQEAGEALLESLPDPADCDASTSLEFQAKMAKLFRKNHRRPIRQMLRFAACMMLVLTVSVSAVLGVSTEARDFVFGWVSARIEGA